MARTNLLDIAKGNGAVGELIDEASRFHPEIQLIHAEPIPGLNFKTLVRTANPTVGFRSGNNGTPATKSTYEERTVTTHIMNPRWEVDKAIADAYHKGAEAWIAMEAGGHVNAAFGAVAAQMYYGGDTAGFPALTDSVKSSMVIDAGGTTAATGSSVWALSFGSDRVQFVVGNDGAFTLTDLRIETITGENGESLDGYIQSMLTRIGLQVGNLNALGRIKDLTEDSGKGLTDALLGKLLAKFPVGYKPDVFLMSPRSLEQLRASRTATNATGQEAPIPESAFGVSIVPTDNIVNTEALS